MDLRLSIIAILLSFAPGPLVPASSQQSEGSRKKPGVPQLSASINENPFLRDRVVSTAARTIDYRGNPFLSVGKAHGNASGDQQAATPPACRGTACGRPVLDTATADAGPVSTGNVYAGTANPGTFNNPHSNVNDVAVTELPPVSRNLPVQQHIEGGARTKSDLECEGYVRQISGAAQVLSLTGGNAEVINVENPNCGSSNRLVIGGVEAEPGEFPHMVALGTNGEDGTFNFYCGGTLISPQWVLSAAHCTYGPNGSPTSARVGFHNLNDNQFGASLGIRTIIRHPSYAPPAMYADIALLKLETGVTFSPLIRPACLYQRYDTVPTKAWVSGWGVTEFGGETTDKLQKALLEVVDNIACTIRHNRSIAVPHGVTPSMICAGDPRGGWTKDTCQGDSGGPLQVIHPKNLCLFQVIGITSFGEGCAIVDKPGVYTRVSHYLEWIEEIVWPAS